jgi:hypothetical protein
MKKTKAIGITSDTPSCDIAYDHHTDLYQHWRRDGHNKLECFKLSATSTLVYYWKARLGVKSFKVLHCHSAKLPGPCLQHISLFFTYKWVQ